MNVRKLFLDSRNEPKYDIYEYGMNDGVAEQDHLDENNGLDDILELKERDGKRRKQVKHSTPFDSNIPLPPPSFNLTSISKNSFSPTNERDTSNFTNINISRPSSPSYHHNKSGSSSSIGDISDRTPTFLKPRKVTPKFSRGSAGIKTPGSMYSFNNELRPSTIVAMAEGRGQARRQIGIAAIDLVRPELTLVQFTDTHTYIRSLTELSLRNPVEIIFPNTVEDERLMKVVREGIDSVSITTVHRKYFNEARGLAVVKHLALPQCSQLERQISVKYYCLAAVAALVRYVEQIQNVTYAPHTLMVKLSSFESALNIDLWSSRKLELVRNLDKGWEYSLFGAIRYTSTPSGSRLLRATLLQPFADATIIRARLGALEYLTQNPEIFYSVKSILSRFPDLDWILSMCVQKPKQETESRMEQRLNYIIGLKNTLDLLNPLTLALENADEPFFISIKKSITGIEIVSLLTILKGVLHEDARLLKGSTAMRAQRCYAIKSDVSALLDVARKIYSEIVDDIAGHVEQLAAAHELPLRVGHNSSRGFHILLPLAKKAPKPVLPPNFIQVQSSRNSITCTTETLYTRDQRSRESVREILIMSNAIIQELLSEIRDRLAPLFGVAEAIASLDMVIGLAHAASLGAWIRPSLDDHWEIRKGRHPILDLLPTTPIVPNDTILNQEKRVMLISGPNMSGKSTYLRTAALIQILTQIGSFVPAESATVKLVHHLFTLFGCEDNPENNASTFQVQMNEVSIALEMAGPQSLILLDELADGTNMEEGKTIAWGIMEGFLFAKSAVILATHMLPLTKMAELYPQITNYYMDTTIGGDNKLHFTYTLKQGITNIKNYGLILASATPLPESILRRSQDLSSEMERLQTKEMPSIEVSAVEESIYQLAHELLAFSAATETKNLDQTNQSSNTSEDKEDVLKLRLKQMLQRFLSEQTGQ